MFSKIDSTDYRYLVDIVGSDNMSVEEGELIAHSRDASTTEWHKPDIVIWPRSTLEVAKILSYAAKKRIPVTPWGAGSSLSGNPVPLHGGIVLDMRRMDKIIAVNDRDLQVTVQPGVNYDRLNLFLSKYGLFFPPDPGSSVICTIGGMVANNASGMRAVHYGVTRDFVLKLEVVLPSGEIIKVGSNAVKSSSGYDLVGLFVGSEGTLGVFTEVTLRLSSLPSHPITLVAHFDSARDAAKVVSEIMKGGLQPAALEFLDRQTVEAINKFEKLNLAETDGVLLVEFQGENSKSAISKAVEICRLHHVSTIWSAEDDKTRERLWRGRKGAYSALVQTGASHLISDVAVPVSRFAELVEFTRNVSREMGVRVACMGHAGDGNLHAMIFGDRSNREEWSKVCRVHEEIVTIALAMNGVSSAEHGIGSEKKKFMLREHGASLKLMRDIKQLVDPYGIMNPGKIFE